MGDVRTRVSSTLHTGLRWITFTTQSSGFQAPTQTSSQISFQDKNGVDPPSAPRPLFSSFQEFFSSHFQELLSVCYCFYSSSFKIIIILFFTVHVLSYTFYYKYNIFVDLIHLYSSFSQNNRHCNITH